MELLYGFTAGAIISLLYHILKTLKEIRDKK
jgi:hypothetical protein